MDYNRILSKLLIEAVKSFDIDEIYQPSGKKDSFRNVSNSSANMYESSG